MAHSQFELAEVKELKRIIETERLKDLNVFSKGKLVRTTRKLAKEIIAKYEVKRAVGTIAQYISEWDKSHSLKVVRRKKRNLEDVSFANKKVTLGEQTYLQLISEVSGYKQQIKQLTKLSDRLTSDLSTRNYLEKTLKEIIVALPIVKKLVSPNRNGVIKPRLSADLMISDLHASEVVSSDALEGFNKYDFKTFAERLWFLTEEVIHLTGIFRSGYELDCLYLDLLGDLVSGNIHEDLLKTNEEPLIPTVVQTAFILSQMVAILSRTYPTIVMTVIPGNHPRNTKKKEFKNPQDNFDWLIGQLISAFLKDYIKKGIVVCNVSPSPSCIVEKEGWRFLLTHGDKFRGGSYGGVPYYTIERFRGKEQIRRRRSGGFDFLQLGDKHTPAGLAMNRILMNGSMIGDTEYSQGSSYESFPPTQKFFLISKKYGATLPVDFQLTEANKTNFVYEFGNTSIGKQLVERGL